MKLQTTSVTGISTRLAARGHAKQLSMQWRGTPYVVVHRPHNVDYFVTTLTDWRRLQPLSTRLEVTLPIVELWTKGRRYDVANV